MFLHNVNVTRNVRHDNYEILNLIGYGLAKFDSQFLTQFGYHSKSAFYDAMVQIGVAETPGVLKNRQDLFDPFFDNGRKGWWQKGNIYIHRKIHIDGLFGSLNAEEFALVVKSYLGEHFRYDLGSTIISPILKSRFKKLQETGLEAELFFVEHFQSIPEFNLGKIEDARLFGDGYDFQIEVGTVNYLSEIKGVRNSSGAIRLTDREYWTATEYKGEYAVIVVSNLDEVPKMTAIFDPIENLKLTREESNVIQIHFKSEQTVWTDL